MFGLFSIKAPFVSRAFFAKNSHLRTTILSFVLADCEDLCLRFGRSFRFLIVTNYRTYCGECQVWFVGEGYSEFYL